MCGHAADNVGRQGPLLPCHAEISLEVVKAVRDNRSNLVMFSKKQQQGFFEGHANGARTSIEAICARVCLQAWPLAQMARLHRFWKMNSIYKTTGWSVRVAVLRGLQEPVRQDGSTA